MKILAKSSNGYKQIKNKVDLGAEGIEIQLLADFLTEEFSEIEYLKMLTKIGIPVDVIHFPLLQGVESDLELQDFLKQENLDILMRVCRVAEITSFFNNKNTLVVIHNGWSLENFKVSDYILDKITEIMQEILLLFPSIEIAIENTIPALRNAKGMPFFRNSFLFQNVDVVNYLRKALDTDRIGTVIDTCHSLTSIRLLNYLKEQGFNIEEYKLEDYFERNKDIAKLIHLAGVDRLGYGKGEHGTPLKEEDEKLLREILYCYSKYKYSCPVTIEVFELDYLNCINFEETLKNVKKELGSN